MTTKGVFDTGLIPAGWFDTNMQPVGWFDDELLDSGGTAITGTMAATLAGVSFAGSGTLGHGGSIAFTLDGITASFSGVSGHTGTLAATLDSILFSASGTAGLTVEGGGPSGRKQRGTLAQFEALRLPPEVEAATSVMAASPQPAAQQIAEAVEDYSADLIELEALRKEFARLSRELERSEDMRAAQAELKAFIADEEEALALLLAADELDRRCLALLMQ